MKKSKLILIFVILFIQFFSLTVLADTDLEINSEAAILIEENSGVIIFEKNANEKMYPASTTKIMTAILVLENCKLDDIVTVSENALNSIPNGYVTRWDICGRRTNCSRFII